MFLIKNYFFCCFILLKFQTLLFKGPILVLALVPNKEIGKTDKLMFSPLPVFHLTLEDKTNTMQSLKKEIRFRSVLSILGSINRIKSCKNVYYKLQNI